jgi:hypothetical protein
VQWLEQVAMRPMLEALLESVCKDKPDKLLNYAIGWMRSSYAEAAEEAEASSEETGLWTALSDIEPTPEGLMTYLKDVNATVILEGIIETAIRKQPKNVVAYVIDELAALRAGRKTDAPAETATNGSVSSAVIAESAKVAAHADPRADELLEAVDDGDQDLLAELLGKGVSPNCRDSSGEKTALIAAAEGEVGCLRLLLEKGASIDLQNKLGETALIAAVKYADAEVISILLEAGANPQVRDVSGKTAVDHAQVRLPPSDVQSTSCPALHMHTVRRDIVDLA